MGVITMNNSQIIVKLFLEAENCRDWEGWCKYLHSNVEYQLIGSQNIVKGRKNYLEHMKNVYSEIKDWKFQIINMISSEKTVIVEFEGNGHFSGVHKNVSFDNIFLQLKAVCVFEIKEEKIYRIREYWDPVGYEQQLNEYLDG
jgi:predicted ester cyclase